MNLLDTLIMAFTNLWRRKLRAVLTALGMAVGTISIVVMISVGIGFQRSFEDQMQNFGSLTKIEVYPGWDNASGKQISLDDKKVREIIAMEHVLAVTPVITGNGNLKSGRYTSWVEFYGVDFSQAELFEFMPSEGSFPEERSGRNEIKAVFTSNIAYNFYDPRSRNQQWLEPGVDEPPVNLQEDKLKFSFDWGAFQQNSYYGEGQKPGKIYNVEVTGIYDNTQNYNFYGAAFIDVKELEGLLKDNKDYTGYDPKNPSYSYLWVKSDDVRNTAGITEELRNLGYNAYSPTEYILQYQDQLKMIQNVLGAIGAVAMLVAAIGIMNTMLMSIVERTREIGVIKVLGCKMGNILTLFLAEASFIGLIGGTLGLAISYGLSYLLNNLSNLTEGGTIMWFAESYSSVIPPWLALLGVAFSTLVALISGLYPSIRAMRLSALEAIRNQ